MLVVYLYLRAKFETAGHVSGEGIAESNHFECNFSIFYDVCICTTIDDVTITEEVEGHIATEYLNGLTDLVALHVSFPLGMYWGLTVPRWDDKKSKPPFGIVLVTLALIFQTFAWPAVLTEGKSLKFLTI